MGRLPKHPRLPSHCLIFQEAVAVWTLYMQGHFSQRIAAKFDCNVARVYDVLHERLHLGSKAAAVEQLESVDPILAAELKVFKFQEPEAKKAANDNQLDLFGDRSG